MLNIEKYGKNFMERAFEYYGADEETRKIIEMVRQDQKVDDCIKLRELAGIKTCPRRKLSWRQNNCHECAHLVCNWLFSEYEQPLLENGDKLKTGDWIMVRSSSCDNWFKRQFLYYYDGKFYCVMNGSTPKDKQIVCWSYARFPEEGE